MKTQTQVFLAQSNAPIAENIDFHCRSSSASQGSVRGHEQTICTLRTRSGRAERQLLGDGAAHRRADDMDRTDLQRLDQPGRIRGESLDVVRLGSSPAPVSPTSRLSKV